MAAADSADTDFGRGITDFTVNLGPGNGLPGLGGGVRAGRLRRLRGGGLGVDAGSSDEEDSTKFFLFLAGVSYGLSDDS